MRKALVGSGDAPSVHGRSPSQQTASVAQARGLLGSGRVRFVNLHHFAPSVLIR
jgi:hypothetical protein